MGLIRGGVQVLAIVNNVKLPSLEGLESITDVGWDFRINENAGLQSLMGLSGLVNVNATLRITENAELVNLNGLNNLETIGGIGVRRNPKLVSFEALNKLHRLDGDLVIEVNHLIEDFTGFESLDTIKGLFVVRATDNLLSLKGFQNLKYVKEDFIVAINPLQEDFKGLESLNFIGGNVSIINGGLKTLNGLEGLKYIGGNLRIEDNGSLTSLSGIDQVAFFGGLLNIRNNPNLATCHVESVCQHLTNTENANTISGNSTNCNSEAAIEAQCASLPDCPVTLLFSNQSEIDEFPLRYPDCEVVEGDLIIEGAGIQNLDALSQLKQVKGDLRVRNNANLICLSGLDFIQDIFGDVIIENNDLLVDLNGLGRWRTGTSGALIQIKDNDNLVGLFGLENLLTNGMIADIQLNPKLTYCAVNTICLRVNMALSSIQDNANDCNTIEEVENACQQKSSCPAIFVLDTQEKVDRVPSLIGDCKVIQGNLLIGTADGVSDITSLENLFPIIGITGNLTILSNPGLQNLEGLNNLASIGGDLSISNNRDLISLEGIGPLSKVTGHLTIEDNESLISLNGLQLLNRIGGHLTIQSNPELSSLSGLNNLKWVRGDWAILNNQKLSHLNDIENVISIGGELEISNNASLSDCAATSICEYLSVRSGNATIEFNKIGCNATLEVLTVCASECLGDIILTTQAQVDRFKVDFPSCEIIPGDLIIDGNDITNLRELDHIRGILGNLEIRSSGLNTLNGLNQLVQVEGNVTIENCSQLASLEGLGSLQQIGQRFELINNDLLLSIFGLASIKSIFTIYIADNQRLNNLLGFSPVPFLKGSLYIINNPTLPNLEGFNNLADVGVDLVIDQNNALTSINALSNIRTLTGDLRITNNQGLRSTDGVDNIYQVDGDVALINCPSFTNQPYIPIVEIGGDLIIESLQFTAISGTFNRLQVLGGDMIIRNNPRLKTLRHYSFLNTIGGLIIENNPELDEIEGLPEETRIAHRLRIVNNPKLSICDEPYICQFINLNTSNGSNTVIERNNPGCNSIQEVKNACPTAVDCPENLYLISQADVDAFKVNFPNCTHIPGDVELDGSINFQDDPLTSLDGLSNLVSIGQRLTIKNHPNLPNLQGLNNLESVDFLFLLSDCNQLKNLSGLNGLESTGDAVTAFTVGLSIRSNEQLENLIGLDNFERTRLLQFNNNPQLKTLEGIESLTAINGDLSITYNPMLENLDALEGVNTPVNFMYIQYNDLLSSVEGLRNIPSVVQSISLTNMPKLTSISGINVGSVGNDIYLQELGVFDLTGLNALQSANRVFISDNPNLINLDGINNLITVGNTFQLARNPRLICIDALNDNLNIGGNLNIFENERLSVCQAPAVCNFLSNAEMNINLRAQINDNALGCENFSQVKDGNCQSDSWITAPCPFPIRLCVGEIYNAGTLAGSPPQGATINWDIDGGQSVRSINEPPLEIFWETPGTKSVTLEIRDGDQFYLRTLFVDVFESSEITLPEVTICEGDAYEFNGMMLTETGVYPTTLTNQNQCDSVVTLPLTVIPAPQMDLDTVICTGEKLIIGEQEIVTEGTHRLVLTDEMGCDSVINLTLTIHPIKRTTLTETLCHQATRMFGGMLRDEPGRYFDTLSSVMQCDSIVTLDLTFQARKQHFAGYYPLFWRLFVFWQSFLEDVHHTQRVLY